MVSSNLSSISNVPFYSENFIVINMLKQQDSSTGKDPIRKPKIEPDRIKEDKTPKQHRKRIDENRSSNKT